MPGWAALPVSDGVGLKVPPGEHLVFFFEAISTNLLRLFEPAPQPPGGGGRMKGGGGIQPGGRRSFLRGAGLLCLPWVVCFVLCCVFFR